jgi:hypothetical protein
MTQPRSGRKRELHSSQRQDDAGLDPAARPAQPRGMKQHVWEYAGGGHNAIALRLAAAGGASQFGPRGVETARPHVPLAGAKPRGTSRPRAGAAPPGWSPERRTPVRRAGLALEPRVRAELAFGAPAECGWVADQPQQVGPSSNLVHCGRAAAGRDDAAALRAKTRIADASTARGRRPATVRAALQWVPLLVGLLLAGAHLPARAQCPDCGTPVSPFVLNETWTAANSPYCVTSDVFVVGLTIESNVTVKVCGNYF